MTSRPAWIEVDLGAIKHNINAIRERLGPGGKPAIMAVIKANAYGHGAVEVAREALASGAAWLGVALPQELIELRHAGIDAPVLVMIEPGEAGVAACIEHDGAFALSSRAVADVASSRASQLGRTARVHVKIDTGMHRMGVLPADAEELLSYLSERESIQVEGLFTHFACADEAESEPTDRQIERFSQVIDSAKEAGLCPQLCHAANSAAAIRFPESHFDLVRVGIAMYGLHPGESTRPLIDLRPALSLKASVARVHTVPAQEGVSYGATYRPQRPTRAGTLPLGYADGYRRGLSGRSKVLAEGRLLPQIGRICMDQFMFEVPDDMGINCGDTVTLIGTSGEETVSADDLADIIGTINYEITTGLSPRLPRVYSNPSRPSA